MDLADKIDEYSEELILAESKDNGKPETLARIVDIPRASENFRFFATAILHFSSEIHEMDGKALNYTLREPVGVAALYISMEFAIISIDMENCSSLGCWQYSCCKAI